MSPCEKSYYPRVLDELWTKMSILSVQKRDSHQVTLFFDYILHIFGALPTTTCSGTGNYNSILLLLCNKRKE